MKISFVGQKICFCLKRKIKKAVDVSLKHLGWDSSCVELAISFLSEEEMRELNNRTRNIDKVTDVLSFPNFEIEPFEKINQDAIIGGKIFLGDMAICLTRAKEQAEEFGHGLDKEVIKLVIHSVLHMLGFDHIKDEDFEVMSGEEEKIATKFYTNKKI